MEPEDAVLTGQVPVEGFQKPDCPDHREVAHNADGTRRWCNACGWGGGQKMARVSGWGTP